MTTTYAPNPDALHFARPARLGSHRILTVLIAELSKMAALNGAMWICDRFPLLPADGNAFARFGLGIAMALLFVSWCYGGWHWQRDQLHAEDRDAFNERIMKGAAELVNAHTEHAAAVMEAKFATEVEAIRTEAANAIGNATSHYAAIIADLEKDIRRK